MLHSESNNTHINIIEIEWIIAELRDHAALFSIPASYLNYFIILALLMISIFLSYIIMIYTF